ncbi:osmotically inducible protein OsmC [Salana multivorans]|uniref:Osmotically inducible protein OsmC n=1 Tax=Salana multivorans TaxID=120377 RepID=A0A3N2D112_9MICO|nr:OsmC family protein [Salana multivorans]MBN8882577.1 OsmC family protein [Salana multivorans]OJX94261.1 MAG: peroxiredoxin [Micrococcales bacterium 73-15]ROR93456.1 osmotically inducible protein OsmC [Salana multivorans]
MPRPVISTASSVWEGDLASGGGRVTVASDAFPTVPLTWKARSEGELRHTTPEELIAAAHAGCYSMALSNELASSGSTPERIEASANVTFEIGDAGPVISGIELTVEGKVPGISEEDFLAIAEAAKVGCPVSKALAAVPITLSATLV